MEFNSQHPGNLNNDQLVQDLSMEKIGVGANMADREFSTVNKLTPLEALATEAVRLLPHKRIYRRQRASCRCAICGQTSCKGATKPSYCPQYYNHEEY
jgi:uncharacterized protein HemY